MKLVDADNLKIQLMTGDKASIIIDSEVVDAVPISVIEDIKVEINDLKTKGKHDTSFQFDAGVDAALEIIEKHIRGE